MYNPLYVDILDQETGAVIYDSRDEDKEEN
jgi:hypothetical protein